MFSRERWCWSDPQIWRQLARPSTRWSAKAIMEAALALGVELEGRTGEIATQLDANARHGGYGFRAVVDLTEAIIGRFRQAQLLALLLADLVLPGKMRRPIPVTLLMTQIGRQVLRMGCPRRRPRPGEDGWSVTIATAYALAATSAGDPAPGHCQLNRRAHRS
jgi:hypothetical protein